MVRARGLGKERDEWRLEGFRTSPLSLTFSSSYRNELVPTLHMLKQNCSELTLYGAYHFANLVFPLDTPQSASSSFSWV